MRGVSLWLALLGIEDLVFEGVVFDASCNRSTVSARPVARRRGRCGRCRRAARLIPSEMVVNHVLGQPLGREPARARRWERLVRGCAAYYVGCAGLPASGRVTDALSVVELVVSVVELVETTTPSVVEPVVSVVELVETTTPSVVETVEIQLAGIDTVPAGVTRNVWPWGPVHW